MQPRHRNRIPDMTPNAPTEAMLSNADTLMSVQGISKAFGDQRVLADVSFDVVTGEILGLIGPNGAGKTTLLECIAGLLPADAGEVRWRGSPLPPVRRKERLFYVPEAISPYPDQGTAEVLRFFREAYRRPLGRMERLVRALGLEPALAKPVGALSKGYRRRFLLALGLLAPRPVLLMDEPFDGFDLRQTGEVMNLLRNEAADGRTLVLSIHQLGDAQRVCDRLVLLSGGHVMGLGTLAELTASARLPTGTDLEEVFLALA
jgi:ABC-2 type transport system ATP-binding protein